MKDKPRKTNHKQPLAVIAYEKIYQEIIALGYEPGQSLEEKQMMDQLGLGRTPIREALLRLVDQKPVESKPSKGFIVRPITLQNTKATFEMIKILEIGVIGLAIRHDITPFLEKMVEANHAVKSAIQAMDVLNIVEANHDFHLCYAQCSRNEYLIHAINELRSEAALLYVIFQRNRSRYLPQ